MEPIKDKGYGMTVDEYNELIDQVWLDWEYYKEIKNIDGVWLTDYGIITRPTGLKYHKFMVEDWTEEPRCIYFPVR